MSKYHRKFAVDFGGDLKALKKKPELRQQLEKKIETILENPYHYKSLRNVLKNHRRTHIEISPQCFKKPPTYPH